MRFSAIFQLPAVPSQATAKAADAPAEPRTAVQPPLQLVQPPEDLELDARVRLVGEWQLGEGY